MKTEHLKNTISRICSQPRTFEYISKKMGGLDPIKIITLLNEMKRDKVIELNENYWSIVVEDNSLFKEIINESSELYLKKYMGSFDFLKNPHPLDFEWRNTAKSLNLLTNYIEEINLISDKVLLLGMPTLYANCALRNLNQNVTLVERNKPIVQGLNKFSSDKYRIIEKDIFTVQPHEIGMYYSVFMDPPWYSNFLYQFVWLAAKCLKPGGVLVISIPPINTRDNIDEERIEWFSFCQKQGLCVEKLEPEKLEYTMPFFEFNAFRTAGVESILPFWRKGDLVFFRKVANYEFTRPKLEILNESWEEVLVGSSRIRVKLGAPEIESGELKISGLTKGDIIPSVSRSYEPRKNANVWTSGNRAFHVNNPLMFLTALNKRDNEMINEWCEIISKLEDKEYKNYLEHIYYEMERQST